jgi:hypothetical protein
MRFHAEVMGSGEGTGAATDCRKDAAVCEAVHEPMVAVAVNAAVMLVDPSEPVWAEVTLVSTHQWSLAPAARVPASAGTFPHEPVDAVDGGIAQSPVDIQAFTVAADASGEDAPDSSATDVL